MYHTKAGLACVILMLLVAVPVGAQTDIPRLRFAHYVADAPDMDVYLDGELVLEDLAFRRTSPHFDLASEIVEIVIVPAGFDQDEAILAQELALLSGHEYTLAIIGQVSDVSLRPLLLDETTAVGDVRDLAVEASYAILLHGISDGPPIDFYMDGERLVEDLPFGDYALIPVTIAPHDILVTFAGDPEAVLFQNNGETPPSADLLLLTVMVGSYPDGLAVTGAVSRLPDHSLLDFLADYDRDGIRFTTLLNALAVTGLAEELAEAGRYTVFAPTDAAFALLGEEVLEALLADPEALRALLSYHVVEDVFVVRQRDYSGPIALRALDDRLIVIAGAEDGEGFTVNGRARILFGGFPVVINGNVIAVDAVLMPFAD